MIASIHWIVVLTVAVSTHDETLHGGFGAVVWQILNNGKSRPAISAVYERVEVSPILCREKLLPAGVAQRNILGNQYISDLFLLAGQYFEYFWVLAIHFGDFFHVDLCQGWHVIGCIGQELRDFFPFHFDSYTFRAVIDEALEIEFFGTPINKWTETHALDNTFEKDAAAVSQTILGTKFQGSGLVSHSPLYHSTPVFRNCIDKGVKWVTI